MAVGGFTPASRRSPINCSTTALPPPPPHPTPLPGQGSAAPAPQRTPPRHALPVKRRAPRHPASNPRNALLAESAARPLACSGPHACASPAQSPPPAARPPWAPSRPPADHPAGSQPGRRWWAGGGA
jgi:hypothetical protein